MAIVPQLHDTSETSEVYALHKCVNFTVSKAIVRLHKTRCLFKATQSATCHETTESNDRCGAPSPTGRDLGTRERTVMLGRDAGWAQRGCRAVTARTAPGPSASEPRGRAQTRRREAGPGRAPHRRPPPAWGRQNKGGPGRARPAWCPTAGREANSRCRRGRLGRVPAGKTKVERGRGG